MSLASVGGQVAVHHFVQVTEVDGFDELFADAPRQHRCYRISHTLRVASPHSSLEQLRLSPDAKWQLQLPSVAHVAFTNEARRLKPCL